MTHVHCNTDPLATDMSQIFYFKLASFAKEEVISLFFSQTVASKHSPHDTWRWHQTSFGKLKVGHLLSFLNKTDGNLLSLKLYM